jgi:menaquinone-dependent protoporphyrinogen oxidase
MKTQPRVSTRRPALRRIVIGLVTLTAIGGGLFTWGSHKPAVRLTSAACKEGKFVKKRILIAYATRAGSTGEIAKSISDALCEQGFEVQALPVQSVTSIDGCGAIVLGSAVRYGDWLPEMHRFMQLHKQALSQRPLACFTACDKARDQSAASIAAMKSYSRAARDIVQPKTETFFAGKLDAATLSVFERMVVKMIGSPMGDFRDWSAIKTWAHELGTTFSAD